MKCLNEYGTCLRKTKCTGACDLRVQPLFQAGRADCLVDWARHMAGMAKMMGLTEPVQPAEFSEAEEHDFREWLKGMDSREITARNAWAARASLAKMRGEK